MKQFNINEQWQRYLASRNQEIVGRMSLDQTREHFRAFLSGIVQLYMYINSDMHELSEHQALEVFQDIEKQITEFFTKDAEFERLHRVPVKIDVSLPIPEDILKIINDSINDTKPWK